MDAALKRRLPRLNGLGGRTQAIALVTNSARAKMGAVIAILREIAGTLIKLSLEIQTAILPRHTVPPTLADSPFIEGMVLQRISQAGIRDVQGVVWPSELAVARGPLMATRHLSLRALNNARVIRSTNCRDRLEGPRRSK